MSKINDNIIRAADAILTSKFTTAYTGAGILLKVEFLPFGVKEGYGLNMIPTFLISIILCKIHCQPGRS